jgi:hypothetical protein
MIIRGILDRSLSSVICIRGFAPIKELERISKANYKYQRKLLDEQEAEIGSFLETEKYLFFPEVILSYKVKHDYTLKNLDLTPLQMIERGKNFTSNIDKTKIRVSKKDYKTVFDVCERSDVNIIEIELDDTMLLEAIENGRQPFDRIDGNHRLSASKNVNSDRVVKMNVPFCIILAEETYRNQFNAAKGHDEKVRQENPEKFEKVVFHNINTKTIPLTSEENLKVIIDDNENFPDEELEEILGTEALKTRELINKVNPEVFTGIEHILSKQYRTYYIEVFQKLLHRGDQPDNIVNNVFESLKAIDLLYTENDKLKANSSFGLLTAFLYYHVEGNKAKYSFFQDWVLNNNIFEIHEIKAESIIKIFNKLAEKNITVFVAMPYYEGNPVIMETYNQAYDRVMERIRGEYNHVNINLFPIMQYEGKTRDIIENMINEIKQCSIFIADITGGNANVGYELGIARGLKKPTIIVRQLGDPANVPFDYEHDVRNPYNEKAIHTLENEVFSNIVAILANDYGYVINKKPVK